MRKTLVVIGVIAAVLLLLRLGGPLAVRSDVPTVELTPGSDRSTLVVAVHGFGGVSRPGLMRLAQTAFPGAHLIAPLYNSGKLAAFSNTSPYDIADIIEIAIDDAFRRYQYDRIVLIGHSMGGELLRKVYVWGAGEEDDRPARRGRHEWVDHVERFMSLASINRGWTTDPAPENMPWYRRAEYAIALALANLTDTGQMLLSARRGAPFVADLRVQWIRLARQATGVQLPFVIHLLGTQDDIATTEDTKDAQAAKDFRFKSLPDTGHADIATALANELDPDGRPLTSRAETILNYVTLPPDQLSFDEPDVVEEDPNIRRIVFILHGIRDYDEWGTELQDRIRAELGAGSETVVLLPKYGYFPMAPFLLWNDRQEKVRWFMDYYTEALAKYPAATQFDFIGHSNGTYILASALQTYDTLNVNDVYFAGSVVPQRYKWSDLIRNERVNRVLNIVATTDLVVGVFPRFFEQLSEWRGRADNPGGFDIGAAGFRGFQESGTLGGRVRDISFASGWHSTGVDVDDPDKLAALVHFGRYGLDDSRSGPAGAELDQPDVFANAFENAEGHPWWANLLSNISWIVWVLLVASVGGAAFASWKLHRYAVVPYVLLVLAFLNSI